MSDKTLYPASRLILGLSVIALGVVFTLQNLGLVESREVLRWWPVALIAYGLSRVLGLGRRPSWRWGLLVTLGGAWLLLDNLGLVRRSFWELWPILLIFVGVGIVRRGVWGRGYWGIGYYGPGSRSRTGRPRILVGMSSGSKHQGWRGRPWDAPAGDPANPGSPPGASGTAGSEGGSAAAPGPDEPGRGPHEPEDLTDLLKVDVLMSSVSRKVASQQFKGGEIVMVLGGGDIDLRSARMAGETARLEVNIVMGGLNLFVPEDWVVEFQGTPIMGGVEDQSKRPAGPPAGRLLIDGTVFLGGIVVKN